MAKVAFFSHEIISDCQYCGAFIDVCLVLFTMGPLAMLVRLKIIIIISIDFLFDVWRWLLFRAAKKTNLQNLPVMVPVSYFTSYAPLVSHVRFTGLYFLGKQFLPFSFFLTLSLGVNSCRKNLLSFENYFSF